MSWSDLPVACYVVSVVVYHAWTDEVEGVGRRVGRMLAFTLPVLALYFYWDAAAGYWYSSEQGPVNINSGWW